MKRVMKKRNSFAKVNSPEQEESKRVAEVFEAIILEKSQGDGWLGDGVSALKTSLYDDYFNGSDMLAEWEISEGDSQVLALSVDVTFSTLKMSEKIEHIRENVKNGKLGSVKYFKNKDGSFRGERNGIPQVVVGVDRNTVFKLADFWIKGDTSGLASHPVQRVLIDEIAHQLELIKDFAGSRGQKQVADAYSRSLSLIRKIQKQKENIAHGEFGNDRVYKAILEQSKKAFASTDGEKSTG
ncbi:MAG TPA: hypothetical protein VMH91_02010 [Candidatus Paceibacterota bacterium]|nr:hypothetical protein [Candidatus Paceibacterota bacterium]